MSNDHEPGVWRDISGDELKAWRRKLGKGQIREVSTGRRNLQTVDHQEGDTATVSAPPVNPRRDVRQVVDIHTQDMLIELHELKSRSESAFLDRVRKLKTMAGWDHLTDEQAADQLAGLAEKVAIAVTAPVVAQKGRNRVDLDVVVGD